MPDTPEERPANPGKPAPHPLRTVMEALNKIDRILHLMLFLAELSASGMDVDRAALQDAMDAYVNEIDRIAATL